MISASSTMPYVNIGCQEWRENIYVFSSTLARPNHSMCSQNMRKSSQHAGEITKLITIKKIGLA